MSVIVLTIILNANVLHRTKLCGIRFFQNERGLSIGASATIADFGNAIVSNRPDRRDEGQLSPVVATWVKKTNRIVRYSNGIGKGRIIFFREMVRISNFLYIFAYWFEVCQSGSHSM